MKVLLLLIPALLALPLLPQSPESNPGFELMPRPREITAGNDRFRIDDQGLQLDLQGAFHPRLTERGRWFLQRLSRRTTLPFFESRGQKIIVASSRPGRLQLGEDESYRLLVNSTEIRIEAATDLGAGHALETLLQLAACDEKGWFFPGVLIEDAPRFPWRGLMIDVGRHFMPPGVIKRNLDAMAAVKLNVLHLHLTEDQGFRIESRVFPRLHRLGSAGEYFSQDQIRDIISHADRRGIRVMPEFDMPGHAASWMPGHPELASGPGPYRLVEHFGVFDPTMNPAGRNTYRFLARFFREMAELFPDRYVHIGGDENNGREWDANPAIQAFRKKKGFSDNHQLQAYFNSRLLKILAANERIMMGWDEILQPDLPPGVVIHSWRGRQYLEKASRQGYHTVLSNGYYLDLSHNAGQHYLVDPLPDDCPLSPEEQKRILGGEATMWSELVNPENVDSRIWPRAAAIAERLWSPNPPSELTDMYRRLFAVSRHLEESGARLLANRPAMMRRLSGTEDISELMFLADSLEPVEGYRRHGSQKYSTRHPLSRFVDISLPDAPEAIRFQLLLEAYLAEPTAEKLSGLLTRLQRWQELEQLEPLLAGNPNLRETASLAANLAELAGLSVELLQKLDAGYSLSASEMAECEKKIKLLAQPAAEMEPPLAAQALRLMRLLSREENASGRND